MATTHRETLKTACLLIGVGGVLLHGGIQAQTRTQSVTPTLGLKLEHTDNVDGVSDTDVQPRRSENILTINPSLLFQHRGASTTVEGNFGLLVEQRLQGTGDDRISPDGFVRWRTALPEQGLGLDASLQSQQVPPSIVSAGQGTDSTGTTSTQTRASVSPYLERRLSERHSIIARATGLLMRTDPREDTHRSMRTHASSAQLGWLSRPAPFGYSLEVNTLSERTRTDSPELPALGATASKEQGKTEQSSVRATLLYAWHQELEVGLIAGTERDRRRVTIDSNNTQVQLDRDFDGPFGGVLLNWRPTPRTTLAGRYERHDTGRTWNADFSHRLRRTTFGLNSNQSTVRNTPMLVTDMRQLTTSGLITGIPTSSTLTADRNAATNAALSVQQNLTLRVTYEGVRTTLNLTSGRFQSRALLTSSTTLNGTDRSRYNAFLVSYRLTPDVTPSAGLRWNRAQDALGVSRREWVGSLGLTVRLSPWTQLDSGFSLLRSTATSAAAPDESRTIVRSANVKLEHRF